MKVVRHMNSPHQDFNQVVFKKPNVIDKQQKTSFITHEESINRTLENDELIEKPSLSLELKQKIQKARISKNMTQKQLASALNIKSDVINKIEAGTQKPDPKLLNQLKRILQI